MSSTSRDRRTFGGVSARKVVAAVIAMAVAGLAAVPRLATADPVRPPDVPTSLAVPAGHVLSAIGAARGFQIYTCQPQGTGYGWVLLQPQAVLLGRNHKPTALHYGGPSWTSLADGSTVVGTRVASEPAPSGGAIPWLLLQAASTSGPAGGEFTDTTYIQRVATAGGLAPAGGCDAASVGATARVAYTADYYFYRAG